MTLAQISQQRDVSLSHAVPYEETHFLFFSPFFFESAESNDDKLLGSLRGGRAHVSYRGRGEKRELSLEGSLQISLSPQVCRREGDVSQEMCCTSPQWQFRPNSSDPEGGNSDFCLPGRGAPPPTLLLASLGDKDCHLKKKKSMWSPGSMGRTHVQASSCVDSGLGGFMFNLP